MDETLCDDATSAKHIVDCRDISSLVIRKWTWRRMKERKVRETKGRLIAKQVRKELHLWLLTQYPSLVPPS